MVMRHTDAYPFVGAYSTTELRRHCWEVHRLEAGGRSELVRRHDETHRGTTPTRARLKVLFRCTIEHTHGRIGR